MVTSTILIPQIEIFNDDTIKKVAARVNGFLIENKILPSDILSVQYQTDFIEPTMQIAYSVLLLYRKHVIDKDN